MALELQEGPRGLVARWKGLSIASAYDPQREASQWADRIAPAAGSLVFVAGDPWGLASSELQKRGARAVALLPGAASRSFVPPGVENWAPEDGPLEDFVLRVFDGTGPDGVVWETWPAFERAAPELTLAWTRTFRDVFRTVQGSWLTQRRFGPRFWRNTVRNFLDWEQAALLVPGSGPLVIAASGPSLDDGLSLLAARRDAFTLWALPSSFETLRALSPDAGVATDGGYYAREHLHRLEGGVPLLSALSAAADPSLRDRPCQFFSQGHLLEQELLKSLGAPYPEVPSQGTVAVTALRLAQAATTGNVFIAGLDLCYRSLRGHTFPHTVDRRHSPELSRLSTAETRGAADVLAQSSMLGDVRTSPALQTYASWFEHRARFPRTVYRVAPSAVRWKSMTEVGWTELDKLLVKGTKVGWSAPSRWPSRAERRNLVLAALDQLAARCETHPGPWMTEAARTAVPEALAEDFQAQRRGQSSTAVSKELARFLRSLREAAG